MHIHNKVVTNESQFAKETETFVTQIIKRTLATAMIYESMLMKGST